ncbi:MAG TPA: glycosyltransferase family 4 protein [Gammaproteobacteria bacterium]|nr:glycosyltransferase family 4 protein [Gammaproteobacteria bacterium]
MPLIVLVGACLAAVAMTALVRRYALARAVVDVPNERSLHTAPTPRGGGLAIALVVLAVHAWLIFDGLIDLRLGLAWGLGAGVLAVLGWIDDHRPLGTGLRFGVQTVVIAVAIASGAGPADAWTAAGVLHAVAGIVGLVWFVNLYNFMDGADGLAGTQSLLTALLLGLLALDAGARSAGLALLALSGASAGFLRYNLPPATIFLGDVGSYFLGGYLGLYLWQHVHAGGAPWPWLIVLSPFVTDATLTLASRIIAGERWWAAHRRHAYQRLVTAGWSHGRLVTAFALYGLPLAGLAWLAQQRPALGPWFALLAYVSGVTIWRMIAAVTNRRARR